MQVDGASGEVVHEVISPKGETLVRIDPLQEPSRCVLLLPPSLAVGCAGQVVSRGARRWVRRQRRSAARRARAVCGSQPAGALQALQLGPLHPAPLDASLLRISCPFKPPAAAATAPSLLQAAARRRSGRWVRRIRRRGRPRS